MQYVWDYVNALNGCGILNKPIYQPDVVPTILFAAMEESTVQNRFINYSAYMKNLRKARAAAGG